MRDPFSQPKKPEQLRFEHSDHSPANKHPEIFEGFVKNFFKGADAEMAAVYQDALIEKFIKNSKIFTNFILGDPFWTNWAFSREDLIQAFDDIFTLASIFERYRSSNLTTTQLSLTEQELRAIYTYKKTLFFFDCTLQKNVHSSARERMRNFFLNFIKNQHQPHKENIAKIFKCKPDEVSTDLNGFFQGSKVHFGDLAIAEVSLVNNNTHAEHSSTYRQKSPFARTILGDVSFAPRGLLNESMRISARDLFSDVFQDAIIYGSSKIAFSYPFETSSNLSRHTSFTLFGQYLDISFSSQAKEMLSVRGFCSNTTLALSLQHEGAVFNLQNFSTHSLASLTTLSHVILPASTVNNAAILFEKSNNLPKARSLSVVFFEESLSEPLNLQNSITEFHAENLHDLRNISLPSQLESLTLGITQAKNAFFPPYLKKLDLPKLTTLEGLLLPPHAEFTSNTAIKTLISTAKTQGRDILQECRDAWMKEYQTTRFDGVYPDEEGAIPEHIPLLQPLRSKPGQI